MPKPKTPKPTETPGDLIDTAAAADVLNLAESTLRMWRTGDKGPPYYSIRSTVRYSTAEIKAWDAAQTVRVVPSG